LPVFPARKACGVVISMTALGASLLFVTFPNHDEAGDDNQQIFY
jgi:hypothetical protein